MIVEYIIRGRVEIALGDAPVGRSVAFPMCVIYQFDEAGKLASERVYADSGGLLPQPIICSCSGETVRTRLPSPIRAAS